MYSHDRHKKAPLRWSVLDHYEKNGSFFSLSRPSFDDDEGSLNATSYAEFAWLVTKSKQREQVITESSSVIFVLSLMCINGMHFIKVWQKILDWLKSQKLFRWSSILFIRRVWITNRVFEVRVLWFRLWNMACRRMYANEMRALSMSITLTTKWHKQRSLCCWIPE